MKKQLLVALCALVTQAALAERLKFSLDCAPDKGVARVPAHISQYKITKTPFQREDGKWDSKFAVEVYFKSAPAKAYEYALVPAGSGDEDYSEYDVKATPQQVKSINVQGAYINNRFKSASLIDTDGVGFADCRAGR